MQSVKAGDFCVECQRIGPDGGVSGEVLNRTWGEEGQAVAEAMRWAALLYQTGQPFRVAVSRVASFDEAGNLERAPTEFRIEFRAEELELAAELPDYGLEWLN